MAFEFDVFGRSVLVVATRGGWEVFYPGAEGKRRPADDIRVPPDIPETGLARYLDDLCHEWASERHPRVRLIRARTLGWSAATRPASKRR